MLEPNGELEVFPSTNGEKARKKRLPENTTTYVNIWAKAAKIVSRLFFPPRGKGKVNKFEAYGTCEC